MSKKIIKQNTEKVWNTREEVEKAAKGGDGEAQRMLGLYYWVERDNYKEAFIWTEKAAKNGCVSAYLQLAKMYQRGIGTEASIQLALTYYKKSASYGVGEANEAIGSIYKEGKGVAKNLKEAFKSYKKAAELDDSNGYIGLGDCYFKGEGTFKNKKKALKCYEKAWDLKNDIALFRLVDYYGEIKDYDKVEEYLQIAAKSDDGITASRAGQTYLFGKAIPQDVKKAIKILNRAYYELHDEESLEDLMDIYEGRHDIKYKDKKKAFACYLESAKHGDMESICEVANCYEIGRGVEVDYKKAFEWYLEAAEAGYDDAKVNLVRYYQRGIGVEESEEEAIKWEARIGDEEY